ncbi:MAG: glycoside hydrolase family 3 N-terminal domain-containing protein, partial [Gemmatimonadota bacterium]
LLARMTLEEKLGQLNLLTGHWAETGSYITDEQKEFVRKGLVGGFFNVTGADTVRAIQRIALEESRLGIPLLFGHDVIHGFRTIFPIPLAEAATWDPEAVEAAARVGAVEGSAAGLHWTFAPMVDIARDPRWGRIAEGAGEDPYLGSVMAAARVRGFQGEDLRAPESLLATAKHFAAYGGAEAGRDYNTVDVSEWTLREIYLPPFRAAVEAGAGSVMTAFNEIAGVPATANRWLLTEVLREEWGFDGLVVSDYTAVAELQPHGVAATPAEAGRLALAAGTDMDMVSEIYVEELPSLVRDGTVPESVVDRAVRHVLATKIRLGLFDDPYRGASPEREREVILSAENRALAREVAHKSVVLLKNEGGLLPLDTAIRTLAVIGPLADSKADALGSWHALGRPEDVIPVLDGIRAAVSPRTRVLHAKGADVIDPSTAGFAEAVRLARQADLVIAVLGERETMSGEAASRADIGLPGVQGDLLKALHATGKPVVLVLMNGRPLAISWAGEHVPAIVEAWFLGVEMGPALADVLFGKVNPSGKLPVTFPRALGQVPLHYNHKNTGRPPSEEKYTSKYLDVPVTPLFPFGHGLSYTTFEYADLRLSRDRIAPTESLTVSVTIRNTGPRDGVEVVQLYVQDEVASVTRPVKELAGFRRVTLKAGESTTVELSVRPEHLAFYDLEMQRVIESGFFRVFVGPSSAEGLEQRFEVTRFRRLERGGRR